MALIIPNEEENELTFRLLRTNLILAKSRWKITSAIFFQNNPQLTEIVPSIAT